MCMCQEFMAYGLCVPCRPQTGQCAALPYSSANAYRIKKHVNCSTSNALIQHFMIPWSHAVCDSGSGMRRRLRLGARSGCSVWSRRPKPGAAARSSRCRCARAQASSTFAPKSACSPRYTATGDLLIGTVVSAREVRVSAAAEQLHTNVSACHMAMLCCRRWLWPQKRRLRRWLCVRHSRIRKPASTKPGLPSFNVASRPHICCIPAECRLTVSALHRCRRETQTSIWQSGQPRDIMSVRTLRGTATIAINVHLFLCRGACA